MGALTPTAPGLEFCGMRKVLIADPHEVVRWGVWDLLRSSGGFELCGETGDGRGAIEQARKTAPDVAVLDVALPGPGGFELLRQLGPRTAAVVLTEARSEDVVRDCLGAGAMAYVLKSDPLAMLLEAVRSVVAGKPFLTPGIAQLLVVDLFGRKRELRRSREALTAREREVLQLLAEGMSNKEVARALAIGARTVETHRMNLMAKLECRSIAQLVRYAVRNQLVCA